MLGRLAIDLQTNDVNRTKVIAAARVVFEAAVEPALRDDRFDRPWEHAALHPDTRMWTCVGYSTTTPVAYLGGRVDDDHILRLEALYDVDLADPAGVFRAQLDELRTSIDDGELAPVASIEIWAKPAPAWLDAIAEESGFETYRGLHQMRRSLPIDGVKAIPTRSFVAGDAEQLRLVNNRSFASHPAQGRQTPEQWSDMVNASWFRHDGVRVYEHPVGAIAGFCITKIHSAPTPIGEIYVIGLDPSVHGRGLGGPMTAAGLDWLADQGLTEAMLYVEADNEPAIRTYERLGFVTVRTDRAWRHNLGPTPVETWLS